MRSISTKAIILGHKNFGEFHKLIFLYTEEFGKLKVIAKGSRKITSKFTGHLETLNLCEVNIYFGPQNIILTEISTLNSFKGLRNKLNKLTNALQIAEISNRLIYENQKFDNLIEILSDSILKICDSENPSQEAADYLTKLIEMTGLTPDHLKSSFLETFKTPSTCSNLSSSTSNLSKLSKSSRKEFV